MEKLSKIFKTLFSHSEKEIARKTNEIIDYINDNPVPTVGYKVYNALLTQTGTDVPVETVLQNTFESVWLTRVQQGQYRINFQQPFDRSKLYMPPFGDFFNSGNTCIPIWNRSAILGYYHFEYYGIDGVDTYIVISVKDAAFNWVDLSELLGVGTILSLPEIRVYN